jgi:quercetin dioxygenase-like cupin family protein
MKSLLTSLCLAFLLLVPATAAEPGAYARTVTVTPLLKTQTDGAGKKLAYPVSGDAEVTVVHVEIPAGTQSNWHKHPVPCFAYMLEGELQVEMATGEVRTFKAGEAFAEVTDLLHNGINRTNKTAKLVMFVIGTTGQPYAVRAPAK